MRIADLHAHTTASDGALEPAQLLERAARAGVELLAITDHDSVDGYLALRDSGQAEASPVKLLAGVELSSRWQKIGVHIVGLNIDPDHPAMREAMTRLGSLRMARAKLIDSKLARQGIEASFEAALVISEGRPPCRPHFAQVLINRGLVKNFGDAFDKYLGNGKMRGLNINWPELAETVGWIVASGGVAVLAHPEAYGLTRTKLWALAEAFQDSGGQGVEMAAPDSPAGTVEQIRRLCRELGLHASAGSDFHSDKQHWRKLGKVATIPAGLQPVWDLW